MQIMNKKFFIIIFIIGASFFLSPYLSCNFFSGISSTSDTLEILVVREDGIEDDKFELFKKYFFLPQKSITETELTGQEYNIFNIVYINRSDFSEYFKGYQNIVFVSADNQFLIQKTKEQWIKDQTVLYFSFDPESKEKDLLINTQELINKIKESEIERRMSKYNMTTKKEIKDLFKDEFNLPISLPSGFYIVEQRDGMIDMRRDFDIGTHRLIVQKIANQDGENKQLIIDTINTIFEQNIYGELEGSFAVIDDVYANFYMERISTNNQEIFEMRGLWKIINDPAPMGGPFLGYILDLNNDNDLFIGFCIFAPGEDKATHLIDAEAIGKSFFN